MYAVTVIGVVLCGVDTALSRHTVRATRRILDAEALHVVSEFAQRCCSRAASQAGAHDNHGVLPLVGGVHQLGVLLKLRPGGVYRGVRFAGIEGDFRWLKSCGASSWCLARLLFSCSCGGFLFSCGRFLGSGFLFCGRLFLGSGFLFGGAHRTPPAVAASMATGSKAKKAINGTSRKPMVSAIATNDPPMVIGVSRLGRVAPID